MFQETKATEPFDVTLKGYTAMWNVSARRGYAGTLCLFRSKPDSIVCGFGDESTDSEGRVITLEYPQAFIVNLYVPNSQGAKEKWFQRLDFDDALRSYAEKLSSHKPLILCGDFNVAHDYLDIYPENTRNFEEQPGFSSEERGGFNALLDVGLTDAYRALHSDERAYTWWAKRFDSRALNKGRRLDYFLVSDSLIDCVRSCDILTDITISDHAPIVMEIDI
jgi:exodeoxyribonuclease-3